VAPRINSDIVSSSQAEYGVSGEDFYSCHY
jgi:hypothetical protein